MALTLRLILGDQLNAQHSWFQEADQSKYLYVMMEIKPESEYVTHHIQKVLAFFLAMRTFTEKLQAKGLRVKYFRINDSDNLHSFESNLKQLTEFYDVDAIEYQEPDEYRLDHLLAKLKEQFPIPVKQYPTEHFITERFALKKMFPKRNFLMETFYRKQRKELSILMEGDKPLGEKWNYDSENRKKYDNKVPVPAWPTFHNPISEVLKEIQEAQLPHFGNLPKDGILDFPISEEQAATALDFFTQRVISHFGTYEDAMDKRHPRLFHSYLSFALNLKILNPLAVVRRVEEAYKNSNGNVALANVEGFIRQIIGWREYVRGIYWAEMPSFSTLNFFEAKTKLPSYFWTAETKMACLKDSLGNSLDNAYAHHIQRLMVIGNFSTLIGANPDEVDQWYLGVYADAIEWVEMPNTRGMSQYADGGIVGSKPYVSSAAYINKMSNYCGSCHYNYKEKTGSNACPFNALYWDFYERNRSFLQKNPRIGMMYNVWDKMEEGQKEAILKRADYLLKNLESL